MQDIVASPAHTGAYNSMLQQRFVVHTGAVLLHSQGAACILCPGWQYFPAITSAWPECRLEPLVSSRLVAQQRVLKSYSDSEKASLYMALQWSSLSGRMASQHRREQLLHLLKYLDTLCTVKGAPATGGNMRTVPWAFPACGRAT